MRRPAEKLNTVETIPLLVPGKHLQLDSSNRLKLPVRGIFQKKIWTKLKGRLKINIIKEIFIPNIMDIFSSQKGDKDIQILMLLGSKQFSIPTSMKSNSTTTKIQNFRLDLSGT